MIACTSRATLLPTRLFGPYEAYGRHRKLPKTGGRIHIAYDRPISIGELDPGKTHPERYLEASRRIMSRISALELPKETLI